MKAFNQPVSHGFEFRYYEFGSREKEIEYDILLGRNNMMINSKHRFTAITALILTASLILNTSCSRQAFRPVNWKALRAENTIKDKAYLHFNAIVPERPLTLDDIISIAMQRNLSLEVKQQELAIQREAITREKYRMLPKIRGSLEISGRTENTASFSQSLIPGVPPAPLSISSEQHVERWESSFVFNLLDFGLSYFRHQQEKNKLLIAQLEYEKLQQNLVVDITKQYWKGVISAYAVSRSKDLAERALEQQVNVQRQMREKVISEIQGLRSENQLVGILQELQAYEKEYHSSKAEIGLLMGIPPERDFELAFIDTYELDAIVDDLENLETIAMTNRPELRNADIEEELRKTEIKTAILQLMPGVELFGGPFHDSNLFLLHNNWLSAGVRALWNLLDAPGILQEKKLAEQRKELARRNRLALSIGVMAQVYLAYIVYQDNLESYILSKELENINKRLLRAAKSEQRQGRLHEADILRYQADSLFSEVSSLKSYGELQNSLEHLNNAIGSPLYFRNKFTYKTAEEAENANEEEISWISDATSC